MKSKLKYQKIARKVLLEQNILLKCPDRRTISWVDGELMERLFYAFGGTRHLNEKTIPLGCSWRFQWVMDKLDYESQSDNSIFIKGMLQSTTMLNRPTRCFTLKEEHV